MGIAILLNPFVAGFFAFALGSFAYFLAALIKHRSVVRRMIRQGKPVQPHSFLLGHLLPAGEAFGKLPPQAHSGYALGTFIKNNRATYVDTWPLFSPLLTVTDPNLADQAVCHHAQGALKPPDLEKWFRPITGGPSMFDANGAAHRYMQGIFGPSFSAGNVYAEVGVMLRHVRIFKDRLQERAQGSVVEDDLIRTGRRREQSVDLTNGTGGVEESGLFRLEPLALSLVIDIIAEVLLSLPMCTQRGRHPLADAMLETLELKFVSHKPENFLAMINPFLKFRTWNAARILDNLLSEQLKKRFNHLRKAKFVQENGSKQQNFQSVIDLAIQDWMKRPENTTKEKLDKDFLAMSVRNMRMFFFAGYDSSAATITYCLYNLTRYPEILARMRMEHDEVLGAVETTTARIAETPAILNSLPYTDAVIKETLRLFPPAGGIRSGSPDLVLTDDEGNTYPTEGFSVNILHTGTHRNPLYWARPDEFLPERWTVPPGHELHPAKGAWRPFEYGPRMCAGKTMVMTEIKAVLASVCREFDFVDGYAEFDQVMGIELSEGDLRNVGGDRAYLVERGAGHPVEGWPCRVRISGYGR